jgi:hypothetical protein
MHYDFKIKAEISHVKLISKAFDILKSISKGEISRAACLLEENKTTFAQFKLDYPEFFDIRIQKIKKDLLNIEQQYFSKSLNILQLGEFGSHLTNCKQRFIDTGVIMKNKRLNSIEINVTEEDLKLINFACKMYYRLQCGYIEDIILAVKHKIDHEAVCIELKNISNYALGFQDEEYRLEIFHPALHRKSKWAYDICNCIDNYEKIDIIKNIGTLSKLKVYKNG